MSEWASGLRLGLLAAVDLAAARDGAEKGLLVTRRHHKLVCRTKIVVVRDASKISSLTLLALVHLDFGCPSLLSAWLCTAPGKRP